MTQFLCVHGHFYQPPREDPDTGKVPLEVEAAPYHDFNEKITAECYQPNAEMGNFEHLSFDVGPTLGQWLRRHHPAVLSRIAAADRSHIARAGYGNALMQSFHHTILPLAAPHDRRTELAWGVRWFEETFGRRPKGIWLPETAVDTATLEACADAGLVFTILSPAQAARAVDPRLPYVVELPSGRSFDVVFYDAGLSGTVSFNPSATSSAPAFLEQFVLPRFAGAGVPGIVTIATDGEVYGHHHSFKDYFIRDLLTQRAPAAGVEVASLEQFLAVVPGREPITLLERSSWGCGHELLRWSGDCACTPGDGLWKRGLRRALDNLATRLDEVSVEKAAPFDIWALRDAFVDVVIGAAKRPTWLRTHGIVDRDEARRVSVVLDAQRYRLAMFASCAFYWDDLTRIEAGYGVRSGLHAAEIFDQEFGTDLRAGFLKDLEGVVGWKSEKSAAQLYARSPRSTARPAAAPTE